MARMNRSSRLVFYLIVFTTIETRQYLTSPICKQISIPCKEDPYYTCIEEICPTSTSTTSTPIPPINIVTNRVNYAILTSPCPNFEFEKNNLTLWETKLRKLDETVIKANATLHKQERKTKLLETKINLDRKNLTAWKESIEREKNNLLTNLTKWEEHLLSWENKLSDIDSTRVNLENRELDIVSNETRLKDWEDDLISREELLKNETEQKEQDVLFNQTLLLNTKSTLEEKNLTLIELNNTLEDMKNNLTDWYEYLRSISTEPSPDCPFNCDPDCPNEKSYISLERDKCKIEKESISQELEAWKKV